jgi:hypothetical protein
MCLQYMLPHHATAANEQATFSTALFSVLAAVEASFVSDCLYMAHTCMQSFTEAVPLLTGCELLLLRL